MPLRTPERLSQECGGEGFDRGEFLAAAGDHLLGGGEPTSKVGGDAALIGEGGQCYIEFAQEYAVEVWLIAATGIGQGAKARVVRAKPVLK